jgi:polysaccharide pyruvyl transferase WcaK-like protein
MTIDDILNALHSSKTTVAMRYHGHIFSIALNVPFISIDYTGKKGKVSNLLERISYVENSVEFKMVSEGSLKSQLKNINLNYENLVIKLKGKSDELENNLFRAYEYFWN